MTKENVPSVVCLGFFDLVHRGHAALLRAARQAAEGQGLAVCAHTFDRAPGGKEIALTTLQEREALLKAAGADIVAVSPFNDAMRTMPGDEFFRRVVLEKLNARHVVCGDDHRFGYKGAWGVGELRQMCTRAQIGLTVVPPVTLPNGARISSTAIRRAIREGDFALAESMLGRPLPEHFLKNCQETKNGHETLA